MILQDCYTLPNGVTIPKLGLGTWFIEDDKAAQAVREAVAAGYRLIDTAQAMVTNGAWAKGRVPADCRGKTCL